MSIVCYMSDPLPHNLKPFRLSVSSNFLTKLTLYLQVLIRKSCHSVSHPFYHINLALLSPYWAQYSFMIFKKLTVTLLIYIYFLTLTEVMFYWVTEREKHWQVPSACGLTRDQTYNLGMRPDPESSLQTFAVQGNAPTNWATRQGYLTLFN